MPANAVTTIHAPDGQPVEYPARIVTVNQLEEKHTALKGRVRQFILRADLAAPDYVGLRDAVIRLGRSVYIDEVRFLDWFRGHSGNPPAQARNPHGRGGKNSRAKRPVCAQCNGSGTDPNTSDECPRCSGSGNEPRDC